MAQLAGPDLNPALVTEALAVLADREIVRCAGNPSDAPWQLDHDYLARPILRLKSEQDRWSILLAERAAGFADAGLSLSRRWRSLLTTRQQLAVLMARMRGRLRYGNAAGVALVSLVASLTISATILAIVGGTGWAAWQYMEASRIEASLGGMSSSPFYNSLTADQRLALLDLADGGPLTRRVVAHDIFVRPQQATAFSARAPEMLVALTGLNGSSTARMVTSNDTMKRPDRIDLIFGSAWAALVSIGAASLPAADPRAAGLLDQIIAAIKQTTNSDQLSALAQAYKAVADKLPAGVRQHASTLRTARLLAVNNTSWLSIAQAELLRLRELPIEGAGRLASDLFEPRRVCRRLQALRGWSDEQVNDEQVFSRGAVARGPDGL